MGACNGRKRIASLEMHSESDDTRTVTTDLGLVVAVEAAVHSGWVGHVEEGYKSERILDNLGQCPPSVLQNH